MRLGVNGRFLAAPVTGVQRFAREVVRRLASRPEVTLMLPRGVGPPSDLAPERVSRGTLSGPLWEQIELPRRAHTEGVSVLLHPANSAPLVGGPHVVVLHDLIPLARPHDYTRTYRGWVRLAHARAARHAAAVVTVSDWSAYEIARLGRIPAERISVVPQAPGPLDAPAAPRDVDALRGRLGLHGRYFVALVGADPRKGEAFLRRVWSSWPQNERPPELILVGRKAGGVHRQRGGAPGASWMRRLGAVTDPDLRALYTGAVALLHPAEAEGFGRPPLEALACGTRVVAAPYGSARGALGSAADLVELHPDAWRRAIAGLLVEPSALRTARIDVGRAWATRFSWDDTADRIWAVCAAHAQGAA